MERPSDERRLAIGVDELTLLARQLYVGGSYLIRKRMHHRIRFCPFESLVEHVAPNSSVLDVGCGAGLFLGLLAGSTPGIAGVGFDSSFPAIDAAVRMTGQAKSLGLDADLRFIRLDATDPFPNQLFDVVSIVDVLHHIPRAHQKSVIERASEKVKPGGVLLYKDMANRPAFPALMNRLHDLLVARQWIHYLPIQCVDDWTAELGLVPIHSEVISRLWYRHELRVYRK